MRGALNPARRRLPAAAIAASAALLAAATALGGPGDPLRRQADVLAGEEHAALLQLYSLDSRLQASRGELATIRTRLAELRDRRGAANAQLRSARTTLALSEHRLGRTLVSLYETNGNDALALIFGAKSFADAVDGLDNLTRVASSHAAVAGEARQARRQIVHAIRDLRARASETLRLEAAARARAAELEAARSERAAYIARVRSESSALAERIVAVEAEARAAAARAQTVAAQQTAAGSAAAFGSSPRTVPPPAPEPPPAEPIPAPTPPVEEPAPVVQAPASGTHALTVTATAYSLKGPTATGIPVGYGIVAVDPSVIPFGTRMTIPGYGEGVAADTGSAVRGATIDVWLPTEAQAAAWGTKTLTITLH